MACMASWTSVRVTGVSPILQPNARYISSAVDNPENLILSSYRKIFFQILSHKKFNSKIDVIQHTNRLMFNSDCTATW